MPGCSIERPPDHRRDRVAREVVVGRTEAAGQHDEIDPRQRLPAQIGNQVPIVADDRFRAQLDADARRAARR